MNTKSNLVVTEEFQVGNLKLSDENYIFVTEFNDLAVQQFYRKFLNMLSDTNVKVIPVVVSSYGGQVHALLSMLDIIASSTKPVATIGLGKAMSCGSVLLAAGTKGYRYSAPNLDYMIHEASHMDWGKTTDVVNNTKQLKRLNDKLMRYLATFAGQKDKDYFTKQLKARGNVDWYLTSDECKRLGLVDYVSVPNLLKG